MKKIAWVLDVFSWVKKPLLTVAIKYIKFQSCYDVVFQKYLLIFPYCAAMSHLKRPNDAMHWFLNELTSRIVAESGLPQDRFHLGKIILQSLKDAPNFEAQIDGTTGASMINQKVLERSVRCATAFKNYGMGVGDVIVLMAPNHLDLAIPFYAALYMGIAVAPVDRTLTVDELSEAFNVNKAKMIFCQSEKVPDIQLSLNSLGIKAKIVSFDRNDADDLGNFDDFLDKYANKMPTDQFRPQDFDPEETLAFLITTSGTTGDLKAAAITHKNMIISAPYQWAKFSNFPTPTRMALVGSPLQWMTCVMAFTLSPILRYTRLQSSSKYTPEHACCLINNYKPTNAILGPTLMSVLMNIIGDGQKCDLSCFETIVLGGSHVSPELIAAVKRITPNSDVYNGYGMTELSGFGFSVDDGPPASCGQPLGCHFYRIIDVETQKDVKEPMLPGELWVSGPGIFKEYYNNPEATKDAFAEGKWFKTEDIFYRDEHWNFFYVDRMKLLLEYYDDNRDTITKIFPLELENVIRQHPGVVDVAVAGVPHPECGDLAVACVVRKTGYPVTAQEIKDIVKDKLTELKQLRGVIFLDALPMTASMKVHRKKLKEIVMNTPRE